MVHSQRERIRNPSSLIITFVVIGAIRCSAVKGKREIPTVTPKGIGSHHSHFGVFDQRCETYSGIRLAENETYIHIARFGLSNGSLERESEYKYAFRLGVDPFENNGMGTSRPRCKKELSLEDFILRIFRYTDETSMENNPNATSIWFPKADWRKFCRTEILKEYNSRINTFDTRYIVLENKFYYDIDTEILGNYEVPYSKVEDFKDPELYNSSRSDGRLYLNFKQECSRISKSNIFGPILPLVIFSTLLEIWLTAY